MVHQLNVSLNHYLFNQKKWSFMPKRQKMIAEEMDKLLQIGFIKKITYLE